MSKFIWTPVVLTMCNLSVYIKVTVSNYNDILLIPII